MVCFDDSRSVSWSHRIVSCLRGRPGTRPRPRPRMLIRRFCELRCKCVVMDRAEPAKLLGTMEILDMRARGAGRTAHSPGLQRCYLTVHTRAGEADVTSPCARLRNTFLPAPRTSSSVLTYTPTCIFTRTSLVRLSHIYFSIEKVKCSKKVETLEKKFVSGFPELNKGVKQNACLYTAHPLNRLPQSPQQSYDQLSHYR